MHLPSWAEGVTPLVAVAAVAVLGYMVGRWRRQIVRANTTPMNHDVKRARAVAHELEQVSGVVNRAISQHHASMSRFKERLGELADVDRQASWKELCKEAEAILGPTLRLAAQLAHAYDEIRQQSNQLMTFTEVRTDPLTGVNNRRALDESLRSLTAMQTRYLVTYSIAMVDLDHFKRVNDQLGHVGGDMALQQVARILEEAARETDLVVRYGGEEFAIVMPQTDLNGACILCERMRQAIEQRSAITASVGVAQIRDGETPQGLIERADAALYQAKQAGRNQVFQHQGARIEPYTLCETTASDAQRSAMGST